MELHFSLCKDTQEKTICCSPQCSTQCIAALLAWFARTARSPGSSRPPQSSHGKQDETHVDKQINHWFDAKPWPWHILPNIIPNPDSCCDVVSVSISTPQNVPKRHMPNTTLTGRLFVITSQRIDRASVGRCLFLSPIYIPWCNMLDGKRDRSVDSLGHAKCPFYENDVCFTTQSYKTATHKLQITHSWAAPNLISYKTATHMLPISYTWASNKLQISHN